MFKTILVPTDGSPLSDQAINAAVAFAKECDGRIVGIAVAEPHGLSPLSEHSYTENNKIFDDRMRELAQQHVEKVAAAARTMSVPCETTTALSFYPHEEIINAANKFGCDIVFMASHGRKGLSRLFLGSETQKVLVRSSIPVLVFR